ncbi:MAG: T9SS type A sorting domain-containing protein, partial [Saprospiraceae bacterium]
ILVGADAKSPTINTGHPYFDKFTTARYPQFVVKLKVTDFANQINEAGDVISFNPFRLNLKTNYARCPETWSYFENLPLAFGGSGNYEFTWTTPNGPLDFESNDPQDPNPYFKTPASGSKTYDLLVNMLDGNGAVLCQLSKTIVVTASPLILDLPDVPWPICGASGREIGVFDFSNLGGSGNYGFEWTAADLNHLTYLSDVFSPHPIAKDIQPGQSITYTLTVGDLASQCTASDNLTITSVANNYTVALHGPETVCFGQAVTLMADASPIETDPPWGNVFNQYIWSSNNPHHELSGLGTHVSNLPIDGIVSSHPETYAYTIRYQNAITGCYAEATKSVTIREPWSHVGYVPKIKSAVAGTSQPLWENGINNYISSGADLSQIQVMWDPYPPPTKVYHVSNGNITQLPVNGTFIPTAEVPYLTMTVFDNLTGCSKSYKTIRYILIESNPEFSFLADNIIGCEGGSLCFDIVFDAHLVNYTTSLLPTQLSVKYRIRDPATNNIPIGPIIVDLNLQNNAGLYKGNVCIDLTGLTPNNPNFGYWFELFTNPSSHPIWGSVQLVANTFYLYENSPSDQAPNLIDCIYLTNTSRISIDLGVGCTSPSPQMWSGHLKAKEYIEIHPEGDIELIPQPGLNSGPTLVINPCISPQLESPDLEESVVPPITSDRSTDIQPKPINGEATFEIFPNPFTGEVSIKYSLPPDCEDEAQIKLLDITGKHLRLIDKKKSASGGQFEITFDGKYLPPGVYFYELATGNCRKIKKAVKIGF